MKRYPLLFVCALLLLQPIVSYAQNPVIIGPVDSSPHLSMGRPGYGSAGNTLIARRGYACLHNDQRKTPLWVAYYITSKDLEKSIPRKDSFQADPDLLPGYCAELSDYKISGFDKGHMSPCEDMSRDKDTMAECFYLSNMVPQTPYNNQHFWNKLEEKMRGYVKKYGALYIITGPIYDKPLPTGSKPLVNSIGGNHVAVPTWLYKIVVRKLPNGHYKALAIEVPNLPIDIKNNSLDYQIKHYFTSIRRIEKDTGFNFLNTLPKIEQDKIEATPAKTLWDAIVKQQIASKKSKTNKNE